MASTAKERRVVVGEISLTPSRRLQVSVELRDEGPVIDFRIFTRLGISAGAFSSTAEGFGLTFPQAAELGEALKASALIVRRSEGRC